jgi:hypothetical protein
MNEKYIFNENDDIPSITIESTCAITDIVNKCKNKHDLINELKSYLNKDFRNSTHNFAINVKDEEGKNISEFNIQLDKPQILNEVNIVLNKKQLN